MADAILQVMNFPFRGDIHTELLCGIGLADARNVVLFAFHGHQTRAADGRQIDRFATMLHFALGQGMLHEDIFNSL